MFYMPELGRFLSQDMIRRPGATPEVQQMASNLGVDLTHAVTYENMALSPYVYASSNPIAQVDPSGLHEPIENEEGIEVARILAGGDILYLYPTPHIVPRKRPGPEMPPDPTPPGDARVDRERFARELKKELETYMANNRDQCCNLDANTLISQWMYESNWGRSELSKQAKNLGGVKGKGPAGSWKGPTTEVVGGQRVKIEADFRKYNSFVEYFQDYVKLICTNDRYKNARGKKGREYFEELKKAGYATETNYVDMPMQIYKQLGFDK